MTRFSHVVALGLVLLALAACGAAPTPVPVPVPAPATKSAAPPELLSRMVERYWDEHASLGGGISPQALADSLAVERRYLAEVLAVPRASLDVKSRLTYDIFRRQRELAVEGFTYPTELLAVDPFGGAPQQIARLAEATGPQAMAPKDYDIWQRRIDDYVLWTQQAIANMREGVRRGYTAPRALVERTLPALQRLGEDGSANLFYTHLGVSLNGAVKDKLLPSYRALHDFLQQEYLPRARLSLSLSALPLGSSWYAYRVRVAGGALTPNEIHSLGLTEVERLRSRLPPTAMATPHATATAAAATATPHATATTTATDTTTPHATATTTATDTTTPHATATTTATDTATPYATATAAATASEVAGSLASAYTNLKAQTLAAMPSLFSALPASDFEIHEVPINDAPLIEASGPRSLYYQPAGPGIGGAAVLYIGTNATSAQPAKVSKASFLEEAIPGRHFQSSLQRARTDLPRFRRFGNEPAYVEGWALYAATLGEELGLYTDEDAKAGAVSKQLACAAVLVVDTGVHAKGWTRLQALDYLRTQAGMDDADANLWVDRSAASPGDALACLTGELKIQALRARAQQTLGTRFDVREFHAEILGDGAMPLDILEAKMKLWLESLR